MTRRSCGELRASDGGTAVELCGWVHRRRDHGGLIFVDLRDRDGLTQVVFDPQHPAFAHAEHLRSEDVIRVAGAVRKRPAGTENDRLPTGDVEVAAERVEILNRSQVPPFQVNADETPDEQLRLEYRYLDLRRPRMQRNLTLRHRIIKTIRDFFDERGFIEIETPMLIKGTPEGARDYLVPSRLYAGSFYALPQSPQLLKQICMISGFGRYMQIARCMRDEDLRADRQPEFTQLDVEMSFCTQDEVLETMESCMRSVWQRVLGIDLAPFPMLTYDEVVTRYGTDKPDLRFGLELQDVRAVFAGTDFTVFASVLAGDGAIVALPYPDGAALSRREFDALTERAKELGANGMVWISLGSEGIKSSAQRFISQQQADDIAVRTGAKRGDALLLFAGERNATLAVAGKMRGEVGRRCGLLRDGEFAFCWITGFPYLEIDEESGKPAPAHHPFTEPAPGQWELIERDPQKMRAQHYDMVLNGYELGSGSIRIHKAELQRRIFDMLGMSPEQIEEQFGFFLRALDYGAPPHGGMALGIDRIAMLACGETSLHEVIAFPKTQTARDLMMGAPSAASEKQLRELHLRPQPRG